MDFLASGQMIENSSRLQGGFFVSKK